jgi:hypothetical protein
LLILPKMAKKWQKMAKNGKKIAKKLKSEFL